MKLVRYGRAGAEKPGLIDAEGRLRDLSRVVRDITPETLTPAGLKRLRAAKPSLTPVVPGKPRLGCPLAGIGKIVCIGLNYTDHAEEVKMALPKEPTIFIKANSAISGPADPITRPRGAVKLDYEVELVAVIGRAALHVEEGRALRHVAAYCLMNDVSEREFQMEHGGGTTKGKSCDTFAPIGPWLVTADEIARSAGARAVDHRQRRAAPAGQHPGHGLPGGPARVLREPLHVAPAGRPALHRHARRGGPRGPAAALPRRRRRGGDGDRRPRDPAAPGDRPPLVILVEHGTIITVDAGRRILTDGSVLIDGAEIVQVGPARDVRPPRVPDRVIDARRMVVTPGFVDTHVHLSEHLNRGLLLDDIPVDRYLPDWLIPLYSVMTAEDEEHAALLAGIEMIRTGTTTFCEAGTLFEPAAVAGAMERLGMRAILGRWTWDLESGPARMRQSTRRGPARERGDARGGEWSAEAGSCPRGRCCWASAPAPRS